MRGTRMAMWLAVVCLGTARAEEAKIRDFDLVTLLKLGTELYARDQLASQATDLWWRPIPITDILRRA